MSSIQPEFIVTLKGKAVPLFAGVLDAATRAGLKSLTTEIVQLPTPENGHMAVVAATATFEDGRVFSDIADASPASTSPMLAPAVLRLASTRAKGRCLRDAVNVGQALLEELPDLEEAPAAPSRQTRTETPQSRPNPAPRPPQGRPDPAPIKPEGKVAAAPVCSGEGCGKPLTRGQYEVSLRAYGQPMCPACQRAAAKVAA